MGGSRRHHHLQLRPWVRSRYPFIRQLMLICCRYGWVGVCWLYGPEVSPDYTDLDHNADHLDRTTQVPSCRRCSRSIRRMALLFHHCLCRRHCLEQCWMEDLDLDAAFLRSRNSIRLLHVPRGKHTVSSFDIS